MPSNETASITCNNHFNGTPANCDILGKFMVVIYLLSKNMSTQAANSVLDICINEGFHLLNANDD
jgi:hypothetical protein